jgi:hypothetical protein
MKKFLVYSVILCVSLTMCNKDEVNDPDAPSIVLNTPVISTASGDLFWIRANITDDVGLKSINLLYSDWHLDKTIDLSDTTWKSYDLIYQFLTPEEEEDVGPHKILVTAEDVGGNQTSAEITVRLDKDFLSPVFVQTKPTDGTPVKGGDTLRFLFEVTDERGIDTFILKAPDFGIDTIIAFDPGNPQYTYINNIAISEEMAIGTYYINVEASDTSDNKTSKLLSIKVIESIDNVYLVGGASFNGWNEGNPTPMRKDATDDDWFEITTYSQGTVDNNGVKFLGQKGWTPFNWGLDPSNSSKIINSESSEKIILAEAGYYKVRFNPTTLEYSVEKEVASTEIKSEMYVMGSGYTGYDLNWDPSQGIAMTRDLTNHYVFTIELVFSEAVDLKFLGQTDGWGPFDCGWEWAERPTEFGDISRDLEVGDGTADLKFVGLPGLYLIKMDYHILHGSVTKISD